MNDSQLRAILLPKGHLAISGDSTGHYDLGDPADI